MAFLDLPFPKQLEACIWFGAVGTCLTLAIIFFHRYRTSPPQSKGFFLGVAVFALSYGVARLLETVRKYLIATKLTDIVDAWKSGTQISGLSWDLRISYYVIAWAGIAFFFGMVWKYIIPGKTKYLLTLTAAFEGWFASALYIVQAQSLPWFIYLGAASVDYFIIFASSVGLFAYAAVKSVGKKIRINTALLAIGVFWFIFGVLADLPEVIYVVPTLLDWETGIAPPNMVLGGFILMAVAFWRWSTPTKKGESSSARSEVPTPVKPGATPSPTSKACPACRTTLPITAKYCNMCGFKQELPNLSICVKAIKDLNNKKEIAESQIYSSGESE